MIILMELTEKKYLNVPRRKLPFFIGQSKFSRDDSIELPDAILFVQPSNTMQSKSACPRALIVSPRAALSAVHSQGAALTLVFRHQKRFDSIQPPTNSETCLSSNKRANHFGTLERDSERIHN